MAGLVDRSDSRRYEIERKKYKQTILITSVIGIIAVVLVFAYILNAFFNRSYYGYEVIKTTKRADSNTVKYVAYEGGVIKYSRDGAEAMDAKGNVIWNGSYDLKNPQADICEGYVAIADIGGKEVYIFNGEDSGTKLETLLPILKAEVANQGVVALLLEDKDSNVVSIQDPYDTTKPEKAVVPTNVSEDGYPVDISISNDGLKLVTSYFNINSGMIKSNLSFYYFGEGQENQLVGAESYGKTLIPKVEFLGNDSVGVFGEKSFSLYTNMERPTKIYTETFDKEIKSVFSNSSYVGFVLENYNAKEKYQLLVYSLKGKKILDEQVDFDYKEVYISGKEITFFSDLECIILRLNGNEKFHYTFDKNIHYIMPVNHYEKYIFIDDTNMEEIKLTGGEK